MKFVYDGWNLLAELNATNNNIARSYLWGNDLSGTIQGAGGVGGLLFIRDVPSAIGYCAPAFDGNGNVAALVSMSGGTNCATYEYGPFGEVLRATGPMAKANPFRFSTKYQDDETDLLYYGYRYYNASTGRWNSRDPIGEEGGLNLHGFCVNNPQQFNDRNGLDFGTWIGHPGYNFGSPSRQTRLLTYDDLERLRSDIDYEVRNIPCCCVKSGGTMILHIAGTASGATVTENATLTEKPGCIQEGSLSYYWWDCVSGQNDYANAGSPTGVDWRDYGWYPGGPSQTKTHKGISPWWYEHSLDWTDAGHWNWRAAVIFIYCGNKGHLRAGLAPSDNAEEWTWRNGGWADPHSGMSKK